MVEDISETNVSIASEDGTRQVRGRPIGQNPIYSLYTHLRSQVSSTASYPVQGKQQARHRSLARVQCFQKSSKTLDLADG